MAVPLSSTKHFKVTQQLRQKVGTLDPGQELPTHRSLMEEFEASQATIDRALSTLRREGLVSRKDGSRRLVVHEVMENVTLRVRIIRPDWPSHVYDMICRSVALLGHDRQWLFEYTFYRTMAGLDMEHALGNCQAGMFLTTSETMPDHLVKAFERPRVPLVMVQDHRDEMVANSVCIDDRQMATVGVGHLVSQGHQRILLVTPSARTGPMQDCIAGWKQILTEAGQNNLDELLLDYDTPAGLDSRIYTYERFKAFLNSKHPPFSAIYTANMPAMYAVMRALREQGVDVPGQVSVISADSKEQDGAFQFPPVTTMVYDPDAQAQAVIRLLEQQVTRPSGLAREVWIQGYMIPRESVAPFTGKMLGKP
jgi:DNA-binding LacI/PurR family transcriptional regulator/DNA-binding transcriptional regulator YhcF (GntR family)